MRFADPFLLLLLVLVPVVWSLRKIIQRYRRGALRFSDVARLKRIHPSVIVRMRPLIQLLRVTVFVLLILALARPQSSESILKTDYTQGVDIVLALDCSSSMSAMDLDFRKRNRLEVAKEVCGDFIRKRTSDRLGLVVFAGDAYTQCPMTLDYGVMQDILSQVSITMNGTIPDNTAIGLAVARCLKRLENSEAKSRVIILLTDGMNNAGEVEPLQAANIAKTLGVRLYTIGAGSRSGVAPVLQEDPLFGTTWRQTRVEIDDRLLTEMADQTGGKYYRAGDMQELREIFRDIDQLEKTEFKDLGQHRYYEQFVWFALAALILVILEIGLAQTRFRTLP
jgi:Ca-activated chloride channel family protein